MKSHMIFWGVDKMKIQVLSLDLYSSISLITSREIFSMSLCLKSLMTVMCVLYFPLQILTDSQVYQGSNSQLAQL